MGPFSALLGAISPFFCYICQGIIHHKPQYQDMLEPTITTEKSITPKTCMVETKTRLAPEVKAFIESYGKSKGLRLGPQLRTIVMEWYMEQKEAEKFKSAA